MHSKLNKFSIKKLDCYIVSDLRFLLEIQDILPETSPFLSAQMVVLSSFFQILVGSGEHTRGKLAVKQEVVSYIIILDVDYRTLEFMLGY